MSIFATKKGLLTERQKETWSLEIDLVSVKQITLMNNATAITPTINKYINSIKTL